MKFINSRSRAIGAAFAATLVGLAVVTVLILIILPREEWSDKIAFSWVTALPIATAMHAILTFQILRINRLSDRLKHLVCRDPLTNAASRHFFFERMAMTPDANGAVLMVDIDHFKKVNDTYGHQMGDAAIRVVAQTLTTLCRGQDMVCRFGGEEFVIFIYEVTAETALGMAEILRASVAHEPIEHSGTEITVTVSIGVSMKARKDHIDAVIGDADAALYSAKEAGRDRVAVSWMDELPQDFGLKKASGL